MFPQVHPLIRFDGTVGLQKNHIRDAKYGRERADPQPNIRTTVML